MAGRTECEKFRGKWGFEAKLGLRNVVHSVHVHDILGGISGDDDLESISIVQALSLVRFCALITLSQCCLSFPVVFPSLRQPSVRDAMSQHTGTFSLRISTSLFVAVKQDIWSAGLDKAVPKALAIIPCLAQFV